MPMKKNSVLVLSDPDDPQLSMLDELRETAHVAIGNSPDAFKNAAASAEVIFNWSGSLSLIREVFLMSPAVRWVHSRSAGLELGESGGVLAGPGLETAVPGVFAAGDIAEYESPMHGRSLRVEHWDVAFNHGKTVALNMLGRSQPHEVVPYFFSDLSDWASLEYVGPASEWEQEVVRGSIEAGEFSIFYLQAGHVAGALSVGRSEDLEHARRWISSHTHVADRVEELGDLSTDLASV